MSDHDAPSHWRFQLIDLFFLTAIVAALLALLLPAVQVRKGQTRRTVCKNNLKQIGFGVHNFHDTFNGLPPLALGDARASMFVLIYPFCEAQNIYNLVQGDNERRNTSLGERIDGSDRSLPSSWTALSPIERDAVGAVKWMHCPARRSGIQHLPLTGEEDLYAGPTGDYAVVFIDQDPDPSDKQNIPPPDTSAKTGWHLHQNPCNNAEVNRQKGAIRLAAIGCEAEFIDYAAWKPRDTFARITDGTANTLIVGEKNLRAGEIGRYSKSQDDQDGVYWFTSATGGRNYNVARNIAFPLANGPNDKRFARGQKPPKGPRADFGFGIQHNDVAMFLRADGSVTNHASNTDPQILRRLGHAQDGLRIEE